MQPVQRGTLLGSPNPTCPMIGVHTTILIIYGPAPCGGKHTPRELCLSIYGKGKTKAGGKAYKWCSDILAL